LNTANNTHNRITLLDGDLINDINAMCPTPDDPEDWGCWSFYVIDDITDDEITFTLFVEKDGMSEYERTITVLY